MSSATTKAMIEVLENRTLMSSATLSSGTLKVVGDDSKNDTITLRLSDNGSQVIPQINGKDAGSFALADMTKITVKGRDGKDTISIDETNGRIRGVVITIYGGLDNDKINGGTDKIKVLGEDGNDRIVARGYLDGGDGKDTIYGSNADDYCLTTADSAGEGVDLPILLMGNGARDQGGSA